MIDKTEIQRVLDDIILFEYEKSYAFIGCARWGKPNWYGETAPSLTDFEQDVKNFSIAVYQFAHDCQQQEKPFALSSLYISPKEKKPDLGDYDGDVEDFEEDMGVWEREETLQHWAVQQELVERNVLFTPTELEYQGINMLNEPAFRCIEAVDRDLFETMMAYYNEKPVNFIEFGHLFICFKDYVINLTENGWAVYARRHADIEFVRWFFTLISYVCNMNPAFLYDTRHPLLDGYNPLKPI